MREPKSHLERMSRYCALLAEPFGLDPDTVRGAAWLHDIGMAGMDFATLPGPLGADERRELALHPEIGAAMLRGVKDEPLATAAEIAATHHERWDGSGYPRGLSGEQIPLAGRIAAVADAFDALTTDRPYRTAVGLERAASTLRAERAHHFDADVVDALLARLDEAQAIHARFLPDPIALVSPQEAGALLGWSPSKVRRWANTGRLPTIRTSGGHRRFPLDAVLRLATTDAPEVRPLDPPSTPLPAFATLLTGRGRELTTAAAELLYRGGPPGWFAADFATPALNAWLRRLAAACVRGDHPAGLAATDVVMVQARAHATTLLERHTFLERCGQLALRELATTGAHDELPHVRRLIVALQQSLLDHA